MTPFVAAWSLNYAIVVSCVLMSSCAMSTRSMTTSGLQELKSSSDLQRTLRLIHRLLGDETGSRWPLHRNTDRTQKRSSCIIGAGMTHHCTVTLVDKTLTMRDRLRSGISPGKKRSFSIGDQSQHGADVDFTAGNGAFPAADDSPSRYGCLGDQAECRTAADTIDSVSGPRRKPEIVRQHVVPDESLFTRFLFPDQVSEDDTDYRDDDAISR